MVAILSPNSSIRESFYYNENKVKEQVATCLMAENYPFDLDRLTEVLRLDMLRKLAGLNTRTSVNCLHISLNFDPSETIAEFKLKDIARDYMEQLGFGNQPYLVYQHFDAGHPHLHIVSTNIQADGKRIDLHHLGIRKSEPARKDIEHRYKLMKAENQKAEPYQLQPVIPQKVNYGKSPTKRAIGNVLKAVIDSYKYASVAELNAVLNQYNVHAEQGAKDSRIYKNNGLVYRVLGPLGSPVGVPIKSSLFSGKATLKHLSGRFKTNELLRHKHKLSLRNAIDGIFARHEKISLESFIHQLEKSGIHLALWKNEDGMIYGITYVDHKTKCVFNGSALGKNYKTKAILERCIHPVLSGANPVGKSEMTPPSKALNQRSSAYSNESSGVSMPSGSPGETTQSKNIIELLLEPEHTYEPNPWSLRRRRKKKKRKPSTTNQ